MAGLGGYPWVSEVGRQDGQLLLLVGRRPRAVNSVSTWH